MKNFNVEQINFAISNAARGNDEEGNSAVVAFSRAALENQDVANNCLYTLSESLKDVGQIPRLFSGLFGIAMYAGFRLGEAATMERLCNPQEEIIQ